MALIANNISGSSSNQSRIGITGSVVFANVPGSSFPQQPGTDSFFFVSGSIDGKGGNEKTIAVFGGDVHLSGTNHVSRELRFQQFAGPVTAQAGDLYYDSTDLYLTTYTETGVKHSIGRKILIKARNGDTAQIDKGMPVRVTTTQGGQTTVVRAAAELVTATTPRGNQIFGLSAENIAINGTGYIITQGIADGFNTLGLTVEGDEIFVGTSSGSLTQANPAPTYETISIGALIRSHANQGRIAVQPRVPVHLDDIAGFESTVPWKTGQSVVYNGTKWTNNSSGYNISGSFNGEFSGSLTKLSDGSSYIVAGDGINVVTGSSGNITVSSKLGTSGSWWSGAAVGANNNVLTADGSGGIVAESNLNFNGARLEISGTFSQGTNNTTSGQYSSANGDTNQATGDSSHAEGVQTTAIGLGSHSEGAQTTASGSYSHAEGSATIASGTFSHSEGRTTRAIGSYSHAEGRDTYSVGDYSHAEGFTVYASGSYSHAEGSDTRAVGDYSHAEGQSTISSGTYSHAEGIYTIASGSGQTVVGKYNARGNNFSLFVVGSGTGDSDASRRDVLRINQGSSLGYDRVEITGSLSQGDGQNIASGPYSHAQGQGTDAIGARSHAEGVNTTALGTNSHAEGNDTLASAGNSHAEGDSTKAYGVTSHAEGSSTESWGAGSHAEGLETKAYGDRSHSEGYLTEASGTYSHAEGQQTKASGSYSHAEGEATRTFGIGSHAEGQNTRALGNYSHAQGSLTEASGTYSLAAGIGTIASGSGQAVFGRYNSRDNSTSLFVIGAGANDALPGNRWDVLRVEKGNTIAFDRIEITGSIAQAPGNTASGRYSSVRGVGSKAVGDYSRADGYLVVSNGPYSYGFGDGCKTWEQATLSRAYGYYSIASGTYSNAEGYRCVTEASSSHAEGYITYARGINSHAEGWASETIGQGSHAEGYVSYSTGSWSHAEGASTRARGDYSHSEGSETISEGLASHAEGDRAKSFGTSSHAEGQLTVASGSNSHAEGERTKTYGTGSHAEGYYAESHGDYSHAEGYYSIASGTYSHAEGIYTIASGSGQTVVGKYNTRENNFSLFVVGNGTGDANANRSDVLRVNAGQVEITGSLEVKSGTALGTTDFGMVYAMTSFNYLL